MPIKPERIHGKQVYVSIDGYPTRRIQTVDYNSSFDIDTIYELGNKGFVEEAIDNVETPITLTGNEWGSTDLEAMMVGRFEQKNVIGSVGVNGFILPGAVAGQNATIGEADHWLTVFHLSSGTMEFVKVNDVIATTGGGGYYYALQGTYNLDTAPAVKDYVARCNRYTITEDDFDDAYVDLILPYRYSPSSTNLMYSVLLPRAVVNNITYRYDTGGAADISYSLVGEEERIVLGSMRELVEAIGSFMSYNGTVGNIKFAIPTGHEALSLGTGGKYLVYAQNVSATAMNIVTASISAGEGRIVKATIDTGLGLDSTGRYRFWCSRDVAGGNIKGFTGLSNITNSIGKLKKGNIVVSLGTGSAATGTAISKVLRISGVDVTIPLSREALSELGTDKVYGRQLENPYRFELTLSFSKNDLREYALLVDKLSEFDNGTLTEILMSDLKDSKNTNIWVSFYSDRVTHDATTLLKTMYFNGANFIGDSTTTPVTGSSGLDLSFSVSNITVTGSGLPPKYL